MGRYNPRTPTGIDRRSAPLLQSAVRMAFKHGSRVLLVPADMPLGSRSESWQRRCPFLLRAYPSTEPFGCKHP
jgi:hypothetical protein